jgi:Holliday junction resolvasome RuvABC endonuclease subunit
MTTFLSIDPGLNFCGISVISFNKIDDNTGTFEVLDTILVKNARKFTDEEKVIETKLGNRTVKVLAILSTINELLFKHDIESIVVEAPFYNALTPMAYGSLLEIIFAIKYSIVVDSELKFKLIEPLLIKKIFTNMSQANKEQMKKFLLSKKEDGSIIINKNIEELSEHEIDSIAVGFVHVLTKDLGD